MFKKIFKRINDFIQWTKKWHFFHVFIIPNTFTFMFICFVMPKCSLLLMDYYSNAEIVIIFFTICFLALITHAIIALCAQIFFLLSNWIKSHNINIKNKFLLNNKFYNILYIIGFIYNILCFLSFICFCFLSFFCSVTLSDFANNTIF